MQKQTKTINYGVKKRKHIYWNYKAQKKSKSENIAGRSIIDGVTWRLRSRVSLSTIYYNNDHVFKPFNGCVVVRLEVVTQDSSFCMVALRAVEMYCTSSAGNLNQV